MKANKSTDARYEVFHPELDDCIKPLICHSQEDAEFLVKHLNKFKAGHHWRVVVGRRIRKVETGA